MEYNPKNIASVAEYYFGRLGPSRPALDRVVFQLRKRRMTDRPYACFLTYFKRTEGADHAGCTSLLVSDRLLDDYDSYYRHLEERAAITTRNDFDAFSIRMAVEDNPARMLEDRHAPLSPLFRFMTANELGLHGIAAENTEEAINQLAENPFFFEHYKSGFPVTRQELLPEESNGQC